MTATKTTKPVMPVVTIVNVVAKSRISGFDKEIILDKMNDAEYRPNGFPAICVSMNGIILSLFDSGKLTSTRGTSINSAISSINNYIKRIRKLKMDITILSKPTVSMIVSRVSFGGEKKMDIATLKRIPQFKKEIKKFSSIQLVFAAAHNNVSVLAYADKVMISGSNMTEIISVINILEEYTTIIQKKKKESQV